MRTKNRHACLAAVLLACVVAALSHAAPPASTTERLDADDPRLVQAGRKVYASHCAACHGAELEGQPDWRRPGPDGRLPAPPHDESGHTWHHADSELIRIVERGFVAGVDRPPRYEGNMPAFGEVLSREEIVAALSFIKSTWSFDYRAWQERVNAAEGKGISDAPPSEPPRGYQKAKGDALFAASFKQFSSARLPLRRFEGKPLVVYFWATWCKPCREETQALVELRAKHATDGLVVLGIGVDQSDRIRRFAEEARIDFPVFVGGGEAIELSKKLGNLLGEMPFVAAVDRQGSVGAVHLGAFDERTPAAMAAAALR